MTSVVTVTNALLPAVALCLLFVAAAMAAQARIVLVIYSNNRLVPGNVEVDQGLRAALSGTADRPVRTFSEFLDEPDFKGQEYEASVVRYLRERYATRPPDAVVAVSNEAFDFQLRNRAQLFLGIPGHAVNATAPEWLGTSSIARNPGVACNIFV